MPAAYNHDMELLDTVVNSEGSHAVFNDTFLGDRMCETLVKLLKANTTKTDLQLRGNCLGCEGVMALAELLRVNTTVRSLSLEWNSIGTYDVAGAALAGALEVNRTLTYLDLRNTNIGPDVAMILARAFRVNDTLEVLDLRWNEVGDMGAEALLHAISTDAGVESGLKEIRLSGNQISEDLLSRIDAALKARHGVGKEQLEKTRTKVNELEVELERRREEEKGFVPRNALDNISHEKESVALELEASASKVIGLEHDLLQEKGTTAELRARLEAECASRQREESLLSDARAAIEDLQAKERRHQEAMDKLHDERRELQHAVKQLRTAHDEQEEAWREERGNHVAEMDTARQESGKLAQALRTAEGSIVQLRAKLDALSTQLEHETEAVETTQQHTRLQMEELKNAYEERITATTRDTDRKLRQYSERAKEAEEERRRATAQRENALRDLSRIQVELEERLIEQEKRIRGELETRHEAETAEIMERLTQLQRARELQDVRISQQAQVYEEVKTTSAAELREMSKAIKEIKGELEMARDMAREHECRANKLQVAAISWEQRVSGLQAQVSDLCKDKAKMLETHRDAMSAVLEGHEHEVAALTKELEACKSRASVLQDRVHRSSVALVEAQQAGLKAMHALEKDVMGSVQGLFASEVARLKRMHHDQQQQQAGPPTHMALIESTSHTS